MSSASSPSNHPRQNAVAEEQEWLLDEPLQSLVQLLEFQGPLRCFVERTLWVESLAVLEAGSLVVSFQMEQVSYGQSALGL